MDEEKERKGAEAVYEVVEGWWLVGNDDVSRQSDKSTQPGPPVAYSASRHPLSHACCCCMGVNFPG